MKAKIIPNNKFKLMLFLFLFITFSSFAGSLDLFTKGIINSNTDNVKQYFSDNIEVTLADQTNVFGKDKASIVINNFLERNKVISFTIENSGNSSSSQQSFAIGNLVTSLKTYKVYVYVDKSDIITKIQFL